MTPRDVPRSAARLLTVTHAETTLFFVNVPAAAAGLSEKSMPRSTLPGA